MNHRNEFPGQARPRTEGTQNNKPETALHELHVFGAGLQTQAQEELSRKCMEAREQARTELEAALLKYRDNLVKLKERTERSEDIALAKEMVLHAFQDEFKRIQNALRIKIIRTP
ncbi:hypothetical protein A3A05_03740 [Candidatus Nomurabacteria bacterium RIFCSPLOWO2_01_FULL_41_12]|uniref:Uncharacterized protein n=1 Tax=Candidatus Nomurabacteria bacterium RIFCSPLOWO2_01_FULL_41_12 TaxID=1801774 RepID=A0A1F6WUN1_9BACT|nr:MAG: hypothetical protein A3A05_03740 [Candidatus Nomurabacteria bacterium RIFCSPLOWO2_01_FULL_41_12]